MARPPLHGAQGPRGKRLAGGGPATAPGAHADPCISESRHQERDFRSSALWLSRDTRILKTAPGGADGDLSNHPTPKTRTEGTPRTRPERGTS